jgi:hypothetical protein
MREVIICDQVDFKIEIIYYPRIDSSCEHINQIGAVKYSRS